MYHPETRVRAHLPLKTYIHNFPMVFETNFLIVVSFSLNSDFGFCFIRWKTHSTIYSSKFSANISKSNESPTSYKSRMREVGSNLISPFDAPWKTTNGHKNLAFETLSKCSLEFFAGLCIALFHRRDIYVNFQLVPYPQSPSNDHLCNSNVSYCNFTTKDIRKVIEGHKVFCSSRRTRSWCFSNTRSKVFYDFCIIYRRCLASHWWKPDVDRRSVLQTCDLKSVAGVCTQKEPSRSGKIRLNKRKTRDFWLCELVTFDLEDLR